MANPNWKPGMSGNPAGRPKGSSHVERCKQWAEKRGWATLEELAKSEDLKIRLEATKVLLAYGFGRPTETHEINGNITLEQILGETNP